MCLECVQKMNNKCIYIKLKINKKIWCTRDNKPCTNCDKKEYQNDFYVYVKYQKKSKKISKLERNRKSILTNDLNHCIICGAKKDNLHEVFFGVNRVNSMKYDCVIPLCFVHHQEMHRNKEWQDYWHKQGQKAFNKAYPHLDFLIIFKRNYL